MSCGYHYTLPVTLRTARFVVTDAGRAALAEPPETDLIDCAETVRQATTPRPMGAPPFDFDPARIEQADGGR